MSRGERLLVGRTLNLVLLVGLLYVVSFMGGGS